MSARSRIGIGIGMCAMVSLLGGTTVFAQAPETSKEAESTFKSMGFKIYGAVDASYTQNFNNPNNNINQLRIFDTQANSFSPNVAQIVFEKTAVASGNAMDRVGFRSRTSFGTQFQVLAGPDELPARSGKQRARYSGTLCRVHRPARQRSEDSSRKDPYLDRV